MYLRIQGNIVDFRNRICITSNGTGKSRHAYQSSQCVFELYLRDKSWFSPVYVESNDNPLSSNNDKMHLQCNIYQNLYFYCLWMHNQSVVVIYKY